MTLFPPVAEVDAERMRARARENDSASLGIVLDA